MASPGFKKDWHANDGKGTVCQVSRSDCEIILCQDANRRDKARLFIQLTADGLRDFRRELAERSVPNKSDVVGIRHHASRTATRRQRTVLRRPILICALPLRVR